MKKAILILMILSLLILVGCQQKVVCNKPYILVGKDCCLDKNNNSICDKDENPEILKQEQYKKSALEKQIRLQNLTDNELVLLGWIKINQSACKKEFEAIDCSCDNIDDCYKLVTDFFEKHKDENLQPLEFENWIEHFMCKNKICYVCINDEICPTLVPSKDFKPILPLFPSKCTSTTGIMCSDYELLQNGPKIKLVNGLGQSLNILSALFIGGEAVSCSVTPIETSWAAGESKDFDASDCNANYAPSGKSEGKLEIVYYTNSPAFTNTIMVEISGTSK